MEPQKIHLIGVTRLTLLILSGGFLLAPRLSVAQSCGGTIQSVSYDTAISSSGSNTYALSFPQFYSSGGYTLMSAVLVTHATTTATVSFANTNAGSSQDFFPELDRKESIKAGATTLVNMSASPSGNYLDGFNDEVFLTRMGMPGDHLTDGPETVYDNDQIVYDSITNGVLASFKGSGAMSLSYQTKLSLNNVNIGVDQTPAPTFSDNINFSLTYYFCNPVVLSENIFTFNAYKEDARTIALSWMTTNDQPGTKYIVELSRDGSEFEDINTQNADAVDRDATYTYNYTIGPADRNQLCFRIKQVGVDGRASYSEVRFISLSGGMDFGGGSNDLLIYPNPPTSYINIQFPVAGADWQVDILSADGSLIQRKAFYNTGTGRMDFIRMLAAGTYFVRATNLQSMQSRTASFVMR